MSKEDADLTSYQLVSSYVDRLNIHGGTIKETGRPDKKKGAHFEIELPL